MVESVKKPWGYEYLLYKNDNVAIWHLFINSYQNTSLHSHPNKKTGLVVLDGAAKVSFLGSDHKLFHGEKIMIRHGVFHQTKSMTPHLLQLLEIETPVDKEDIVRLEDSYGRAGSIKMGEEGVDVTPLDMKGDFVGMSYVWFAELNKKLDFDNFMITNGSISYEDNTVAGPGDIISYDNMKRLLEKFEISEKIEGLAITC